MLKYFGIILCGALLFAAGCATETEPPPDWAAAPATNSVVPATNRLALRPIPPVAHTNRAVAVHTNPIVVIHTNPAIPLPPPPQPAPILTWTSLDAWAAANHLGAPRLLTSSPVSTWAISSPAGTLVFEIGSHEIIWNRTIIQLGFTPEMIDNQIFVHGLDLQKTIEPLLLGYPLDFPKSNPVIVIDPGHGGINAGTLNVLGGPPEKVFTLDTAKRLAYLLSTNGWKVYLTRTDDTDLSLSNRFAFANAHHADLFISLHYNSAAPDRRQNGLETYCLTPTHMPSTLTRGYADPLTDIYPNNYFDVQNFLLAVRLHTAVLHATGEEDRGIRRARFMGVLHGLHCPGVLIEDGYLSNPAEATRIEMPEFRQHIAEAIASALRLSPPPAPPIGPPPMPAASMPSNAPVAPAVPSVPATPSNISSNEHATHI